MEWERYDKELQSVLYLFKELSKNTHAELFLNDHDWPNIMLRWYVSGFRKTMQLFLNDDKETYSFSVYNASLKEDSPVINQIRSDLKYPFTEINYEFLKKYYDLTNDL